MALKTPVVDRIPTYPGRVTLTPVGGAENTYDLVRADQPIEEGTPINKLLFDQKAYTLTENVTVYVATGGNDLTGDGTSAAPYATITKALSMLPKWLDGYVATIDIAEGTYEERITVDGFRGGYLNLGVSGRSVTVRGITIKNSSQVRVRIPVIIRSESVVGTLFWINENSHVELQANLSMSGAGAAVTCVLVERGSSLMTASGVTLNVNNAGNSAIAANTGSRVSLGAVSGGGNRVAFRAETGGVISYVSSTLGGTTGSTTSNGGRIYSGAQSSIPAY